jgi:hypothetical protein
MLTFLFAADVYSQSAKLTKLRSPQPVTITGYVRGHCVTVNSQTRVCKMLSEDKETLLVEREGKQIGTWPANSYLGETSDFEVLRGDLDGDRNPELIVANHDNTSAGMAVSQWTIFIFPDDEFQGFNTPLSFSVNEYGAFGTFVSARRGVDILTTSWMSRKGKGKRGVGKYLVGQWWRYKSGELHPVLNRHMLARRYLASFERERWQTINTTAVPYKWLRHPNTESINDTDQLADIKKRKDNSGIVESVSVQNTESYRTVKIVFKANGEQAVTYVYDRDEVEQGENHLSYIGDAATGTIFPLRYLPSRPEDSLKGRRASIATYASGPDGDNIRILWLNAAKP